MIDRSEDETTELVRDWIRRYVPTFIAGIVLAIAILYGMDWWKNRNRLQSNQYSAQLEALNSAIENQEWANAKALYQDLEKDVTIYGDLAALLMGRVFAQENDMEHAGFALEKAKSSKDAFVSQVARWQIIQLQIEKKEYDNALKGLEAMKDSIYANQISAAKGDIYLLQGKAKDALTAYEQAQKQTPNPLLELRIKALKAQLALDNEGVKAP